MGDGGLKLSADHTIPPFGKNDFLPFHKVIPAQDRASPKFLLGLGADTLNVDEGVFKQCTTLPANRPLPTHEAEDGYGYSRK
jgi:hypothetical protein